MATIYRFIIEQKSTSSGGRKGEGSGEKTPSKKSVAKKGKWVSILGGEKGGVEHNRKFRAINPLLNKITGGYWEKGMRVGRAGIGLITTNTATGAIGLSPVAIAIIISFAIQTVLKFQARDRNAANKLNAQNFKYLENGVGQVHGSYEIMTNGWDGRKTYNENK